MLKLKYFKPVNPTAFFHFFIKFYCPSTCYMISFAQEGSYIKNIKENFSVIKNNISLLWACFLRKQTKRSFLLVGGILFLTLFTCPAYSAEYNCSAYIKYTSCNKDFYLSDCDGTQYEGQTITSPSVNNSCKSCPAGYSCPGSTTCPKINTVTVTYNYSTNGATQEDTAPTSTQCTPGITCTLQSGDTTNFYRAGHIFMGWNTDPNAQTGTETITVTQATTVYAIWQACAAGTYKSGKGTKANATCTPCAAGTYNPDPGSVSSTSCVACAIGSYATGTGNTTCTACAAGTTTTKTGHSSATCSACANSNKYINAWQTPKWAANTVSNLCMVKNCKQGAAYSSGNAYANTAGSCTACSPGTYMSSSAHVKTTCTMAQPGYFVSASGATKQTQCQQGYYQGQSGQTSCKQCPNPKNTHAAATMSVGSFDGRISIEGCMARFREQRPEGLIDFGCYANSDGIYTRYCGGFSGSSCNPGYYYDGLETTNSMDAVWTGVCKPVENGYYFEGGVLTYGTAQTVNECPAGYSGSDNTRAQNTDCYTECRLTIDNGTATPNETKQYYNGTSYPSCQYTVNCDPKYGASGNNTATPACTKCASGTYSPGGTNQCNACTKPNNATYTGNGTASDNCPWTCNDGFNQTHDNRCAQFCLAGVRYIKTNSGLSIPLYNDKQTTPAIVVQVNNMTCYASLTHQQESCEFTNAIHVNYNGQTYYTSDTAKANPNSPTICSTNIK